MSRPKGKMYTVYLGRDEVLRTLAQSDQEAIFAFGETLEMTLDEYAAERGLRYDDFSARPE